MDVLKKLISALISLKLTLWLAILAAIYITAHHVFSNPAYQKVATDVAETVIEDELKLPQGTIKQELAIIENQEDKNK